MSEIRAVIFAGGSGTRLWPISRASQPKQVRPFFDEQTLLQKTYQRLIKIMPEHAIYVSTNAQLVDHVHEQIGDVPLIIEPLKKDTAAAVGYACIRLYKENPQAIMTNAWSDHHIKDETVYARLFEVAQEFLVQHPESIFMAGVKPTYPETGYGYIEMGNSEGFHAGAEVFRVKSFKEKPDLATAKEYMSKWEYLWNPAMFFFRVEHMLNLYKQYLPQMHAGLMRISDALGTEQEMEVVAREFEQFEKISIDYAILEKAPELYVLPVDLGWADIGHWNAIYDLLDEGHANIVKNARYVSHDSRGNLIFSETDQLISTVGVHDSLVIVSKDAILICKKEQAQNVKAIVAQLADNPDMNTFV